MILILTYAEKLQEFLENKTKTGIIQKFKIFMRIGFQLDAYVFATNCQLLQNIETEFYDFLAEKDVYLTNPQKTKIYFNILPLSELNDSYYSNIVNDPNTIDLGPRYRFDSILEDNHEKKDDSLPPVITFYSYKGGVGRTTCMVAYAIHLAKMGKSVAVIDCDLEAPGYLNFFKLSENKKLAEGKKNGVVEFICDTQFTGTDVDINNYIINIGAGNSTLGQNHPELNKIWLVPAGNLNESYEDFAFSENREHYLEGLSKINLGNTQTIIDGFNQLFHHLQKNVACDVILIDSRTGFNDIFGTAVLRLSSCVIGFFGFSQQTVPGFIHLLNEHSKDENRFSLFLAYSILSEGKGENDIPKEMQAFIHRVYDEKSIIPHFFIHRNSVLESIGTGNHTADESFISEESLEYKKLFEELDDKNFPQKAVTIAINTFDVNTENKAKDISSNTRPLILRNIILQHLKEVLSNIKNFAEDTTMDERYFFYRECMKKIFIKEKFIIQGYKGTGKTYLYRALKNKDISKQLQKWAGFDKIDYVFINILAADDTKPSFPFKNISYSKLDDPEYYFNCFWQIYTWNILLYNDNNPDLQDIRNIIKNKSKLNQEILPIDGQSAKIRFDKLISDENTLLYIEEDLNAFNELLKQDNKIIIALYDRLDTCINPLHWNKAVSPLIEYWRQNHSTYSNIIPKIFVRTDLFKQIEGTNTARLSSNIINIEWSIEEVFGYFIKLIFSDETASKAYWCIADKLQINPQYIAKTQKNFSDNDNQFRIPSRADMDPIVNIFFGKQVRVHSALLGKPWDYFSKELANADNKSISLRPFINTLDKNAVDKALGIADPYVREIISPEIYASKDVRESATNQYFDDLAQDAFSKDLYKFKEVIRTAGGERFRYKSLNETDFENLIAESFRRIGDSSSSVKSITDLKNLIFANGIMAETITTRGRFYKFAPIYWYSWGLANGPLESDNRSSFKARLVKNSYLKKESNIGQSPMRVQVYKPDEEMRERIKRSQKQETSNKKRSIPKREEPKDSMDDEMPF